MHHVVPSTHTPNINAYRSMPSSPSRSSDDSADTSGSAMFSPKHKMSSATDSELGSPGTSPSSTSFDPKAGRRSFERHPRYSFEPPPSITVTRRSSESYRRPVVVVHRYADGQERIYRCRNEDGDGYETEYEQEGVRASVAPTASHWSLGSSVVESVKTVKTTEDAKKENKEKLGKKKKLASFMSRLSLAPTHPDAPDMIGRWQDVEFVAPSPSRSRNRSLPLSVRAEMMREKERQRERDKQKVKEQRERVDSIGDNGDPTPQSSGNDRRNGNERSDLHVEGGEHPQIFWEENQNQGQDLGYAPSSMSFTGSSTFTSHVVQTPPAFQSTPSSSSTASTQSWDARLKGRGRSSSTASTPLLSQKKITGTRAGRARADSLSAATSLSSYANAFTCTNTDFNAYPNINVYPNVISTNTNIAFTSSASTSPYRLSFSTPTLPLHPAPNTDNTYTHTLNHSIDSNLERALPPLPLSPASLSSFTLPPSPLSASFKEYGYDLSATTTATSLVSVEKIAPKGLGSKKASILNIRGLAARMMGVHNDSSNNNNNNTRESSESPSKSRSRSTSPFASRKDLHDHTRRYGEPDHLQDSIPFPLYGAPPPSPPPPVPPKKDSKSRSLSTSLGIQISKVKGRKKSPKGKEEKEKRKLVISGIEDGGKGKGEEAVRRWCEAFGEVRAFEKRGRGCLVVDFRKASVADTVIIFVCFVGVGLISLLDVGVSCASASVYPGGGECEPELVHQDHAEGGRARAVTLNSWTGTGNGSGRINTRRDETEPNTKNDPHTRIQFSFHYQNLIRHMHSIFFFHDII